MLTNKQLDQQIAALEQELEQQNKKDREKQELEKKLQQIRKLEQQIEENKKKLSVTTCPSSLYPSHKEEVIKHERMDRYKFIFLGNLQVGKTSLLKAIINPENDHSQPPPTTGADCHTGELYWKGYYIGAKLWDTSGQERFRAITDSYYKGGDVVILVYDITDRRSWESLKTTWNNEINKHCLNKDAIIVVVANKQDLKGHAIVENASAEKYLRENHPSYKFCKTSATDRTGIEELRETIAEALFEKYKEKIIKVNLSGAQHTSESHQGLNVKGYEIKPEENRNNCCSM
jgi:small GTP-binding protein